MGRSYPSFAHDECFLGDVVRNETGALVSATSADSTLDQTNSSSIRSYLQVVKRRSFECWGCTTCGFEFKDIAQPDGTNKTFHFLKYSGTLQLAEVCISPHYVLRNVDL